MNSSKISHGVPTSPARERNAAPSAELGAWMARWLPTLSDAAKSYHRRENTVYIVGFGVALLVAIVLIAMAKEVTLGIVVGLLAMAIACGAVVIAILHLILVRPLSKAREAYIGEMQAAIAQHDFPTAEIVRAIAAKIKSCEYRYHVITAIDPAEATLIISHDKVLALLEGFSKALSGQFQVFEKIGQVSDLQDYAYDYAKAGFYAEAIAMLSAAELLYKGFAAAAPEVKWQSGNMVFTAKAPWQAYSFRSEVSRLSAIVTRRKAVPQVLEMLKAMAGHAEIADLLNIEQGVSIEIRDQEIIDKCGTVASLYNVLVAPTGGLETIVTMCYMPGLPTMLAMAAGAWFKKHPFVPQIIEVCIRRGAEMESSLLEMLRGETANERFNAALALGILRSGEAAKVAAEILDDSPDPLTRIGALFILVHAGETRRQQELLPYLDDTDETTAHAAAIALEHLPLPVPDSVLEKHLRGGQRLVQLRLTRHIRKHTDTGSAVRDAVSALVTGADDDVGMAAAETMSVLVSGHELLKLAQDRLSATGLSQSARRRLLLMVGRARTESAVDLLLQRWEALERGQPDQEYANHILTCMGETHSMRVVPVLIEALKTPASRIAALNALMVVAGQHPTEVHGAAKGIPNKIIKLFVRALLSGDSDEVDAFKKGMESAVSDQRLLALQLAAVLAHPALADALDRLRTTTQGDAVETPAYRYLATKASFAVLTKGTQA
jgi:HEAT repeat protein